MFCHTDASLIKPLSSDSSSSAVPLAARDAMLATKGEAEGGVDDKTGASEECSEPNCVVESGEEGGRNVSFLLLLTLMRRAR